LDPPINSQKFATTLKFISFSFFYLFVCLVGCLVVWLFGCLFILLVHCAVQPTLPASFEENTWIKLHAAIVAIQSAQPVAATQQELYSVSAHALA
jgi:hypothetical protein